MLDVQKFQELHKRYNQVFFDNQLPDVVIVTPEEVIKQHGLTIDKLEEIEGSFSRDDATYKDYILLNPHTTPPEMTLLHEMVHQYCIHNGLIENDPHGILFLEAARQHGLSETIPSYDSDFEMFDGARYNDFLKCGINLLSFAPGNVV